MPNETVEHTDEETTAEEMLKKKGVVVELKDKKVLEIDGTVTVAGTVLPQEDGPFAGKPVRYVSTIRRKLGETPRKTIEEAHAMGAKMVR